LALANLIRRYDMPGLDDLKNLEEKHDDQVDQGLGKAGDALEDKVGHGDQIDSAVDKAQGADGDS
jgi:hypothetical protein